MRVKFVGIILVGVFLMSLVCAVSDTAVFQGQYYVGTEFQQGTYSFDFDIYTGEVFGDLIYTATTNLTTGTWGQWKVELDGISEACNDTTKDYFMEITIDGSVQSPRRRLTHFNYLRKDVDETTTGDLTISNVLNFFSGGFIQELINRFVFSKGLEIIGNLEVNGDANITGVTYVGELIGNELNVGELGVSELTVSAEANINELKVSGQAVCLEDGTDCPESLITSTQGILTAEIHYTRFVSTVDGSLSLSNRYLPLGTDSLITLTSGESSWIIDRNMRITGILWSAVSNDRTATSAITLMKSTTNKASFSATGLSVDIQGQESGSSTNFNESFSQGDLAVIKYESGGRGGDIDDLSITLIGIYD